ncbi:MAG: extracellular solute-binding protein [Thermomicrobiales bacterium]|nr:extracellular solute-binding protein [Thermomicrobiales bacterium]MCO5221745.1 extracellular solute-binding protein [Thermomicrobiales bacterium]
MNRSNPSLGNVRVNRRTLLGASMGAAAVAGLGHVPVMAQDDALEGDISYWHHFTSDSEMLGLEQITAVFEEAHPGVAIISENIPNADFMTQFTTAAVGGSLPNTTMAAADRIPDMLALGGLIDLTERFNAWDGSSGIDPSLMEAATIDGQIYGLPAFLFVDWLYYRKDWFDEAGLAAPDTWEDLQAAAIALTDAENDRYGFGLRGGDGGQGGIQNVMRAYGGLSADENGIPVIDRDKAIEAIAFYAGLFTTDGAVPPSAPNDSYSQIMQAFRTGQTAMVLHHTGSLAEISADLEPGVEFSTAMVPAGPALRIQGVSPQYNGLCKEDNGDAAWAWLTEWTTPDAAVAFLEATGYFPASSQAAADPRITENPIYQAAIDAIPVGVGPLSFVGAPGWAGTSVLPNFQQVLTGQATPEEAVDQMIADLEAEIG